MSKLWYRLLAKVPRPPGGHRGVVCKRIRNALKGTVTPSLPLCGCANENSCIARRKP